MGPKPKKSSGRRAAVQTKTDFSRDISLLLRNATPREQLLVRLLRETGITLKELTSLQKTDLNTHTQTILIRSENTKNELSRTISLSTQLARTLANHARTQPKEHLFSTRQNTQLSTRRVEQIIADACTRAGIPRITARELRNTYLEAAAKTAKNDEQLQELTGLKTIKKDNVLTEKEQERIARVLKKEPAREQALISIILQTSLSLQETLTLTRKDIATLTITPQLAQTLRTLARKPEEQLFSTRQSTQLTTRRAEQLISTIGARAGIRLTSHQLRTTAQRGGQT